VLTQIPNRSVISGDGRSPAVQLHSGTGPSRGGIIPDQNWSITRIGDSTGPHNHLSLLVAPTGYYPAGGSVAQRQPSGSTGAFQHRKIRKIPGEKFLGYTTVGEPGVIRSQMNLFDRRWVIYPGIPWRNSPGSRKNLSYSGEPIRSDPSPKDRFGHPLQWTSVIINGRMIVRGIGRQLNFPLVGRSDRARLNLFEQPGQIHHQLGGLAGQGRAQWAASGHDPLEQSILKNQLFYIHRTIQVTGNNRGRWETQSFWAQRERQI
jgi:hypothetical protein